MGSISELGIALYDLAEDQAGWSQATFGSDSDRGPVGALKHLEKEAREAQIAAATINACRDNGKIDNPADVTPSPGWEPSPLYTELADCLLLVLDAARRSGLSPLALLRAAQAKMKVNKARRWPEPETDAPVEHIKERAMSAKCKSCGAAVIWARTEYGNLIPLDAEPNKPGANMALIDGVAKVLVTNDLFEPIYDGPKYLTHFLTCKYAHEFRRSAKKTDS